MHKDQLPVGTAATATVSKSVEEIPQGFESLTGSQKLNIDTTTGYLYFIDHNHPMATGNAYRVMLHRHLMYLKLGRVLTSEEVVHHIDGNKLNNSISNLQLLTRSEHAKLHAVEDGLNTTTVVKCKYCEKEFYQSQYDQIFCSKSCSSLDQVKNKNITKDLLESLMPTNTWVSLGKMFQYSDNGIKKRAKSLGCDLKLISSAGKVFMDTCESSKLE